MAGFSTAVTGLKASTTMLDVAGNNIANSSTVGFKSSRTEFGDIYATAVVGAGSANVAGSGVTVTDIAQNFKAGTIEFTNNNLDLAINGSGFFQLDDGQGGVTYTRAGAFELNKEGYIVSKNGKFLQGYGLDADGNRLPIGDMAVTQKESPPKATENIDLSFNIDSREDATKLLSPYDKDEPASFTYTTTVRSFDSLGNEHPIKFNFVEQRPEKEVHLFDVDDAAGGTLRISGYPDAAATPSSIDLATDFAVMGDGNDAAFTKQQLDPAILKELQAVDPRIFNVEYDPGTKQMSVIFASDSTEYGDLVVEGVDAALVPDDSTPVEWVDSNEQQFFAFGAANYPQGTYPVTIAGVEVQISVPAAGYEPDEMAAAIEARRSAIIEANPDVEDVTFDPAAGTNGSLVVTFKADAGDLEPDILNFKDPQAVFSGNVVAGSTLPNFVVEGDNSYEGVYRTYAYLNGEEALNLGKAPDPGEGGNQPEVGPVIIKFNPTNGLLTEVNGERVRPGAAVPGLTILGADPADPDTEVNLDLEGSTQFASASIEKSRLQDGYTKGDLIGVTFSSTGEMIASFSNGQNQALGVVAIATFENQSGLQPSGDTEWAATLTSGDAVLNPPGTGLNGTLRSAALEASNVDLSEELVKLIEGQRNFQANSKTLETLNTVTQSILQI